MQAHAAGAGLPIGSRTMAAKSGQFGPGLPGVRCLEDRRVFDPGVDHIRIRQRRLEMPHPFELPWMRRAIVPLMRTGHTVIGELVAYSFPCLAAIARPLYDLPEPAA